MVECFAAVKTCEFRVSQVADRVVKHGLLLEGTITSAPRYPYPHVREATVDPLADVFTDLLKMADGQI